MTDIYFVSITQNRLENLKRNLPKVLPYVDRAVIVDGGSIDGTQEYLESFDKVRRVYYKWHDNFAASYNQYLPHIPDGAWVLICDDDELPSDELLQSLRSVVENSSNGNNYCCVEYRCNPMDPEAGWDPGPVNHYRQIFFRKTPHMKYTVDLHQSLQGYQNGKIIKRDEVYYHIKTRKQEFQNSCRNYFIGGPWPENGRQPVKDHTWYELREILQKHYPDVTIYADFNSVLVQGAIHPELKEWILKYRNIPGGGYGELRGFYTYYFEILHPEEAPR